MSYVYANRKHAEDAAPQAKPAASQPSVDALRSGAVKPTAKQLGHRVDLPDAMRVKMENAFGADLSAVKLYESQTVADAGAEAVAQGSSIAFAPGMLDFTSFGGQALLGHEISHVVSQARGEVTGGGFLNDRALEARADREGAMAARGEQIAMPTAAMSDVSAAGAAGPMQASKKEDKQNYKFGKLVGEKDKTVKDMTEKYDAKQADMVATMKQMGWSDDEIQAQMMFQRVNDSKGMLDRYQSAQGAIIEGSHVTDEHAKDKKAFKLGRGAMTKKGINKRTERENHLINDILVGDQEVRQAEDMASALGKKNDQIGKDEANMYGEILKAQNINASGKNDFLTGQMRIGAHHNAAEAAKKYRTGLYSNNWGYRQKREADQRFGTSQYLIDQNTKAKEAAEAAETASVKSKNFSGTIKGGGLNSAYKFNAGKDPEEKAGYFKQKKADYLSEKAMLSHAGIEHAESGKFEDCDPRLLNREIAYSVLGKLLGSEVALEARKANMEDSDLTGKRFENGKEVSQKTARSKEFLTKAGDTGTLTEEALGDSVDSYNFMYVGPENLLATDDARNRDSLMKKEGLSPERLAVLQRDAKVAEALKSGNSLENGSNVGERLAKLAPGTKITKKSTADWGEATKKSTKDYKGETIDATAGDFQRQMNEMFLLDTLAGYDDRHEDNFKVNQTDDGKGGKKIDVRAIDNDISFGTNNKGFGVAHSHHLGLPAQMQVDANMAKKIREMKKETLEASLGHLLNKKEIDALWERFGMLNEYIGGLDESMLVNEWNEETAKKEFALAGGQGSSHLSMPNEKEYAGKKYTGNNYYQRLMMKLNGRDRGFVVNDSTL
ncbi:MAG: DUF4157 domain-containing protein [Ruminococcaceae bacterium]|nr:DUF4157 domain-containing protein [Oscillospiraceae bacterium]